VSMSISGIQIELYVSIIFKILLNLMSITALDLLLGYTYSYTNSNS